MVSVGSRLLVSDNSGCKKVKCIKILGNGKKKALLGDKLVVSIIKAKPNKKLKKHDVQKVLLIRSTEKVIRSNGLQLNFFKNSVIMVDNRNNPLSSRILGPVTKELRKKKLMKILSMSSSIL